MDTSPAPVLTTTAPASPTSLHVGPSRLQEAQPLRRGQPCRAASSTGSQRPRRGDQLPGPLIASQGFRGLRPPWLGEPPGPLLDNPTSRGRRPAAVSDHPRATVPSASPAPTTTADQAGGCRGIPGSGVLGPGETSPLPFLGHLLCREGPGEVWEGACSRARASATPLPTARLFSGCSQRPWGLEKEGQPASKGSSRAPLSRFPCFLMGNCRNHGSLLAASSAWTLHRVCCSQVLVLWKSGICIFKLEMGPSAYSGQNLSQRARPLGACPWPVGVLPAPPRPPQRGWGTRRGTKA